jgi:hypothetical protein
MMLDINGKSYRVFRVESIHEEDTFVECRDVNSNELSCEIRIDTKGKAFVLPFPSEVDLDVVAAVIEYVKAL